MIFSLAMLPLSLSQQFELPVLPNLKFQHELWSCDGCKDVNERKRLHHQIDRSLRYSDRLSYLTLDSSWLDRLLQLNSKLHITLNKFKSKQVLQKNGKTNVSQHEEVFNVVALVFNVLNKISKVQYYEGIDAFLTTNPCWIPLYEPSFEQFISCTEFLLFVRLPDYSYHATCKLYTAVHARQFPPLCSYDASNLVTYQLPNIGFGHTSLFTMDAMMNALINYKVFTAPFSEPFRSRPYGKKGNGKKENPLLWSWADLNRCPINTFENNPW
jgi:hypothetical protein